MCAVCASEAFYAFICQVLFLSQSIKEISWNVFPLIPMEKISKGGEKPKTNIILGGEEPGKE